MTKQILFIQGGGADVHDKWDNKLVASLARELGAQYDIRYPRMPNESDPRYSSWSKAIEKEIEALDGGAIVIGHSVGGTILINTIAERKAGPRLSGVFLITPPFVGDEGWPSEDMEPMGDLGTRLPPKTDVYLYHGSADDTVPLAHADLYARAIPSARTYKLTSRDHQLNNDMSEIAAAIRKLQ